MLVFGCCLLVVVEISRRPLPPSSKQSLSPLWWPIPRHLTVGIPPPLLPISKANFYGQFSGRQIYIWQNSKIYLLQHLFVKCICPNFIAPWWPVQRHLTVGSPPLLPILKANFSGGQFSGGKFWCQSRGSQQSQNWPRDDLSCTTLCMTGGCRQKFWIRKKLPNEIEFENATQNLEHLKRENPNGLFQSASVKTFLGFCFCLVLVLDSLLNKKSKRIELTLTSSVSRALSYRKLLFWFMRYASFPWTRFVEYFSRVQVKWPPRWAWTLNSSSLLKVCPQGSTMQPYLTRSQTKGKVGGGDGKEDGIASSSFLCSCRGVSWRSAIWCGARSFSGVCNITELSSLLPSDFLSRNSWRLLTSDGLNFFFFFSYVCSATTEAGFPDSLVSKEKENPELHSLACQRLAELHALEGHGRQVSTWSCCSHFRSLLLNQELLWDQLIWYAHSSKVG